MSTSHHAKRPDINSNLSEDAILEILLKLPVKTLLRCKCVCKLWYKIIASDSFVNQHFGSNPDRLLIRHHRPNDALHPHPFALSVDDACSGFEEPAHLQMPDNIFKIMGPVNGVFCLVSKSRELALLNPAMRQLRSVPKRPDVFSELYLRVHDNVLGFGLDPVSGDLKIVSILYLVNLKEDYIEQRPLIFVYNMSSNSWRNVASFEAFGDACNSYSDYYLNGVFYWTLFDASVTGVLAFDMTTERFREIDVPESAKSKDGHIARYGGSIALLSYDEERTGACEVWVMGKGESWNKVAIFGPFEPIRLPICFWKNDELLLQTQTPNLALYNIIANNSRQIPAPLEQDGTLLSWVFSYKESLVSIRGEGGDCIYWDASAATLKSAWSRGHRRRPRSYRRLRLLK